MDKLAQVTPLQVFYIIASAAAVLLSMGLWDWRSEIVAWLRVKRKPDGYVAAWGDTASPTTATQPVAATGNEALRPIATGSNGDNGPSTRNLSLRLRAQVIARLIRANALYTPDGKGGYKRITQTALVELATGLTPNGRPESDYGQLRAELEPLLNPRLVVAAGRPDERVISKA